jgi:hypothetical protein
MTKSIVVPGNPPSNYTLNRAINSFVVVPGNSPSYTLNRAINSIVAAAKTANDLESARRTQQRTQQGTKPAGGEDSTKAQGPLARTIA